MIDYDADDTLYYEPHQKFNDSVLDKNGFKLIKYTEKPIIQSRTKKINKNTIVIMNESEIFWENSLLGQRKYWWQFNLTY